MKYSLPYCLLEMKNSFFFLVPLNKFRENSHRSIACQVKSYGTEEKEIVSVIWCEHNRKCKFLSSIRFHVKLPNRRHLFNFRLFFIDSQTYESQRTIMFSMCSVLHLRLALLCEATEPKKKKKSNTKTIVFGDVLVPVNFRTF